MTRPAETRRRFHVFSLSPQIHALSRMDTRRTVTLSGGVGG